MKIEALIFLTIAVVMSMLCTNSFAVSQVSVFLQDIDSGTTSPAGNYRWMDVADHVYSESYQNSYNYTMANVQVDYYTNATILYGHLTASNLKPNFAYQLKLVGDPDIDPAANERIGLTGRWWQEEWDGTKWTNGQNLNNKGNGSSPNPNDETYKQRRDIVDPTSPTGKKYRYTGYLVFDYFITDASGNADLDFQADSSYHVLWKTSQRSWSDNDGPIKTHTFSVTLPDPVNAYDENYAESTVGVFGEWERLPIGGVFLPCGDYQAKFILTEESFHGSGLAGGWAAAMGGDANFTIVPEPLTILAVFTGIAGLAGYIRKRKVA